MACQPMFEKTLNFECVQDIISDVRNKNVTVGTIKKGVWVLGCGLEFFQPVPIGEEESEKSAEELCDAIEVSLKVVRDHENDSAKIDPATLWMIAQLVWTLIKELRKKQS